MRFVFEGTPPSVWGDRERVEKFARFLTTREDQLMIWGKVGWRTVPSLADRHMIIQQYHGLSHAHPDKLY